MKLLKSVLLLLLFIGIIGLTGMYSLNEDIGKISDFFIELNNEYAWLTYVFQVIVLILVLILLIELFRLLFKPISKRLILRQKKQGKLQFSMRTLETLTIASVQKIVPLNELSIRSKIFISKKDRIKIQLKLSADQPVQFLAAKSLAIENQLVTSFQEMLQLEVTAVDITWKADRKALHLIVADSEMSE